MLINKITELTAEWYDLAGRDHHKDRDCHWYINTVWSYGEKPKYRIEHYGYLLDVTDVVTEETPEYYNTYEEALSGLKKVLTRSVALAKTWRLD